MWETGIAALPILVILILLFVFKQTAIRAGLFAYLAAVLITFVVPKYAVGGGGIAHASLKGFLTAMIVAYVLFFGIYLFHLMNEMKVIKSIASFVASSTRDPVQQVIILCVAFSPLVESASGFGIAIIVIAPILVALGFDRVKAVMLSLVSLSAVPWGALATGTVIGSNLAAIPLQTIGAGAALLSIPTFFFFALLAVLIAGGWRGLRDRWYEMLIVTGSLAASVWAFSQYVSVELAGVLGAMVAIGIEMVFIRASSKRAKRELQEAVSQMSAAAEQAGEEPSYSMLKAMGPYLFLTGLLFVTRLVPPVENFLTHNVRIELPSYSFALPVLYSPGFALLVTCLFTIFLFGIKGDVIRKSYHATMKQWIPVNVSTIFFVAMSEVMSSGGMTSTLANAAALTFGTSFLLFSPLIGGLGGFLTGSNTGSNAMFIKLQVQAAGHLGMSQELFAYSQTASASHLTMASPSRVLLGVSVLGIKEEENNLIRKMTMIGLGTIIILMGSTVVYNQFFV